MGHDRNPALDSVRGLAILLVLMFHLKVATGSPALDRLIAPIANAGWVGVDLFFVLSGFLLGQMILAEARRPGGFDTRRFFIRRILRLWPALYVYLGVFVAIGGDGAVRHVLPVVVHLQNYDINAIDHFWSLAVEEHFYLVSAFALPWLARRGGSRRLIFPLLAIMVGCLTLRVVALRVGVPPLSIQWQTQYRIDALACGVLLAAVRLHHPDLFAELTRRRRLLLGIAAVGFAALAAGDGGAFRHGIGFTIAYFAAAALILAACGTPTPRVSTLFWRCGAGLGTIAYSLYIWHASMGPVGKALALASGVTAPLALTAACYASAILTAWLAYHLVERPMMMLRDRQPSRRNRVVLT